MSALGRYQRVISTAAPIVGAMVAQNVLNLVDTKMVGSLGDASIAAVSSASFVVFACVAFVTGASSGVQALAARRHGEGNVALAVVPLNAGLLLSLGFGVPATLVLVGAVPWLYPYVNGDPAVVAEAVPYLQARLLAIAPIGMNFAFRGYWNGIERPGMYLSTLLVQHSANILASYLLVFGLFGLPRLGSLGAGVGSVIGAFVGVSTYVVLAARNRDLSQFPGPLPDRASVAALLKVALPSSIQQLLFTFGFIVLFGAIARMGRAESAAAGVLINVTLIALLPGMALGLTATTLVGQALGRRDPDDAHRWGWDVVVVGLVAMTALGLPMALAPEAILSFFLPDRPETVAVGANALRVIGALMALDAVGLILMHALIGAGATRFVALVMVGLQWLFFIPAAWFVGPHLGGTLTAIWVVQAVQRLLQAVCFGGAWASGRWKIIRI